MVRNYTVWFNTPFKFFGLNKITASKEGDIDLSSFVPLGTTSVLLMMNVANTAVNGTGMFYVKGKNQTGADRWNFFGQSSLGGSTNFNKNWGEVPISSDRKLHYWVEVVSGAITVELRLEGYRVGTTIIV